MIIIKRREKGDEEKGGGEEKEEKKKKIISVLSSQLLILMPQMLVSVSDLFVFPVQLATSPVSAGRENEMGTQLLSFCKRPEVGGKIPPSPPHLDSHILPLSLRRGNYFLALAHSGEGTEALP